MVQLGVAATWSDLTQSVPLVTVRCHCVRWFTARQGFKWLLFLSSYSFLKPADQQLFHSTAFGIGPSTTPRNPPCKFIFVFYQRDTLGHTNFLRHLSGRASPMFDINIFYICTFICACQIFALCFFRSAEISKFNRKASIGFFLLKLRTFKDGFRTLVWLFHLNLINIYKILLQYYKLVKLVCFLFSFHIDCFFFRKFCNVVVVHSRGERWKSSTEQMIINNFVAEMSN